MKVKFYGVRGSMPTPGEHTCIYGGNTSCVYVTSNSDHSLILDAGTGIIELGQQLKTSHDPIHILLTHNHWDHIQGFPYFSPIFQKNRKITIISGDIDHDDKNAILLQMSNSTHPVKYNDLPADIEINTELSQQPSFELSGFTIKTKALNHPDGGSAYCLYADQQKFAYVTDNELVPPTNCKTSWQQWLSFIENADLLIHDAQYIEADLPLKHGWGHSTLNQVAELAIEANIKHLIIISHDPVRTDRELAKLERKLKANYQHKVEITFAKEGLIINPNNAK